MAATRRLSAIMAADVAGYSRLMGTDEEGTLDRLQAYRRDLIDPKIREHRGRIVKTTGDGLLAEFASIVHAVRCAVEVQRGMCERDSTLSEERRIRFRIGLNLGDIILDRGDIFGDGVNVAARLEALAEPGGICLSGAVHDHIRDKLPYRFEDRGEQNLRNIERPLRVYALPSDAIAALPPPPLVAPRRQRDTIMLVGAGTAAALAIAAAVWWLRPTVQPSPELPLAAAPQAKAAPHLSIVALPFANLTNDPDQQYLADGITEDVTTDLSRLPGMLVISRNSAFSYKNKQIDTKQIGHELNVRYVLEGSVQRAGKRIRVNAQLIDAAADRHLWAERFDRDVEDLFELQNDITARIAVALSLQLVAAEAARPTIHPDAFDYMLRARAIKASGPPTRQRYAEVIALYERAVALDPSSIAAQASLGAEFAGRALDAGMSTAPRADLAQAEEVLAKTLPLQPQNPALRYLRAQITRAYAQGDFKLSNEERQARFAAAITDYEAVLAANPNDTAVMQHLAWCRFMTGASDQAIALLEKSIALSPKELNLYLRQWRLGTVFLFRGNIAEAIDLLEKARAANPTLPAIAGVLAAAYGLADDPRAAALLTDELTTLRQIGETRYSTLALIRKNADWNTPALHEAFERYFIEGLRKAGMPEE